MRQNFACTLRKRKDTHGKLFTKNMLWFYGLQAMVDISVTDGRERVCADPGKRDAILGTGGPTPPGKGEGQQLVPDSGGGETSMTTETGDGLATTSRDGYEQSECCHALYSIYVVYL
jgi:hypothetical protein